MCLPQGYGFQFLPLLSNTFCCVRIQGLPALDIQILIHVASPARQSSLQFPRRIFVVYNLIHIFNGNDSGQNEGRLIPRETMVMMIGRISLYAGTV